MARLTNAEIRNMPINEADAYTDLHPAEAWRFAKAHGKSAIQQTKKAAKYGFKSETIFADPETVEALLWEIEATLDRPTVKGGFLSS